MKTIALDISALGRRHYGRTYQTGVYRYALELSRKLSQAEDFQISFLTREDPLYDHFDLYHNLFHSIVPPKSYQDHPKTETLVTFHDLIAWLYPELFPLGSQEVKRATTFLKSNWFLSPSNSTKRDLVNHFSIDPKRIFVTPLAACNKLFYPRSDPKIFIKYQIPKAPYFLFVGRLEERKGVHHLLEAFYTLIEQEKLPSLNLILCGPLTSNYSQIFHSLYHEKAKEQPRVFHIPFADNADLAALYSQALGFIFLSQYEGFGLPLLEAMQCATPPICFNHSSHPEVVGTGGILAPNLDLDFVCEKMLMLYKNPYEQKLLSKKALERSKLFSWEETTQKTLEAYHQILNLS